MEDHYPQLIAAYPNYFIELGDVKSMRDSIAHNTIAYEQNTQTETDTKLILNNPKIKKQKRLTKRRMEGMMVKTDIVFDDTRAIFKIIGKKKKLNFS